MKAFIYDRDIDAKSQPVATYSVLAGKYDEYDGRNVKFAADYASLEEALFEWSLRVGYHFAEIEERIDGVHTRTRGTLGVWRDELAIEAAVKSAENDWLERASLKQLIRGVAWSVDYRLSEMSSGDDLDEPGLDDLEHGGDGHSTMSAMRHDTHRYARMIDHPWHNPRRRGRRDRHKLKALQMKRG